MKDISFKFILHGSPTKNPYRKDYESLGYEVISNNVPILLKPQPLKTVFSGLGAGFFVEIIRLVVEQDSVRGEIIFSQSRLIMAYGVIAILVLFVVLDQGFKLEFILAPFVLLSVLLIILLLAYRSEVRKDLKEILYTR